LSTCEAEYMVASATACQGIWLGRVLEDLRSIAIGGVKLKVDNQSTLPLMKNLVFHNRRKHICTRYHFI
jgi:hypothetical protein